jgi:hypothetical protein
MTYRAYADPDHPGNRIRPRVRCRGCGAMGATTRWGPWCLRCNVERIERINGRFAAIERRLRGEGRR